MSIHSGDIIGVTGPNGAGKTTLLRLLATLYRPTEGRCTVLGMDSDLRPEQMASGRREIALIGHTPAVWPELTLRENIDLVDRLRGDSPDEDPLEAVGLEKLASLQAGSASLGMQRRVEFARLLNRIPRLLLLDEPMAGLDRASRPLVERIMERVVDKGGAAALVSHDSTGLAGLINRRITVSAGVVTEEPQ